MLFPSDCLYGINPVAEAVRAGRRELRRCWLNREMSQNPRLKRLLHLLETHNVPVEFGDKGKLFSLCGTREHQGAVLECGTFPYTPYADVLGKGRLVLLDSVEDPHNVGAILRSAEVFGWDAVLLPRRGAPLILPSVAKSSAGACEHLTICCNCSPNQYVKIAMEEGYEVAALDGGGTVQLAELASKAPAKLLLVVGGEDSGVSQFILNNAQHVVSIPQKGKVNSLNASVAAGLALYALQSETKEVSDGGEDGHA